jgi:hypothetical protein
LTRTTTNIPATDSRPVCLNDRLTSGEAANPLVYSTTMGDSKARRFTKRPFAYPEELE